MLVCDKPSFKFRHELKHSINAADDRDLVFRLGKIFFHDENTKEDGTYRVSSLYFDTPFDKALRQKIDGVNCREKFRIRYYEDNTSFIRLEKKLKMNGLCGKYSTKLTKEQVEQILDNNIDFLLDSGNPLLIEFYSKLKGQLLRPRTIVTYEREAFLYEPGNVRITIDRKLHTSSDCRNFLNPELYHIDVSDDVSILEVKYDEFLPEIVRLAVQIPNRQASAFSKYAVCRRYD